MCHKSLNYKEAKDCYMNDVHHMHDIKLAVLETENTNIRTNLIDIKSMLEGFEHRFDVLDGKIIRGFERSDDRIWSVKLWMISGFAGILCVLAHAMKWI